RGYRSGKALAEVLGLLVAVMASGLLLFFHPVLSRYPLSFACLPPLLWAAFRCGQREAATALALLALIATAATATGRGFFVLGTPGESLIVLQTFMAVIGTTTLVTAALVAERETLLRRERDALVKAEAASRAKDHFLAVLSHELRNPLGAISVATAVLEQLDHPHAEAQRWRATIHRQTEHLARLIDDLLDVARITEGKLEMRLQAADLGQTVTRCIRTLRAAGTLRQHRTTILPESVWVRADPDRIEQIITNLVMNAIKYTPVQGTIEVRTFREGDQAVLRVSDSGIGISPELLPHVFELFAQGEQGLARVQGGLGIGLTLVRRLAELHGGSVEVTSAGVGRGSTFTVRFPLAEAPMAAGDDQRALRASNSHPRGKRVLIIEDNDDAREALRALLVMTGNEVEEAADGESGVDAAARRTPDIALVDIGLPRVDGYEVARRIRARTPTVRLVAVTGYGRDEDKQKAREAGFDAHLLKPVNLDRLRSVMAQLTGHDLPHRSESHS
ncbi:MAG TPA: ATP-binding protein, partial [Gemmatimonadaceae bacterium]|nr:ATP-binding protein [Gemmatimonadaceae bacterium]